MTDEKSEPWRYNFFIANNYWHDAPNIAARFWDADPKCDFALLASVWHSKNDFGRKLDPVFAVQNILEASRKPGFEVGDVARIIHATYLGYLADRERQKTDPIIVIAPPPPEPPKVEAKPSLPQIKVPQEKKNPAPALVKFSVWFGILATAAGAAAFFFPQAKPIVAIVVALVQSILKYFGV
jgi:hypothetical protein